MFTERSSCARSTRYVLPATSDTRRLEDSPTLFPYFFNYLSAHSKKFAGIGVTAIGHMFLGKAGQV